MINDISCEVRRRRWNWLGHILRKEGENDYFTALDGLLKEGKRKTKNYTWRRTVEKERNKAGWKSSEVQAVAQNRKCWSDSVEALCVY